MVLIGHKHDMIVYRECSEFAQGSLWRCKWLFCAPKELMQVFAPMSDEQQAQEVAAWQYSKNTNAHFAVSQKFHLNEKQGWLYHIFINVTISRDMTSKLKSKRISWEVKLSYQHLHNNYNILSA